MKKQIKVSVIIPNWNGVHLLKKFLPSIIAASKDSEILVIDDCSQDNSVEYLKHNFPEVKVITHTLRKGFSSTINDGVSQASGELVVLLNTDIEPERGYLSALLPYFSDKNVFAVGCLEKSHENNHIVTRGRGVARWYKGFYIHKRGEVNKSNTAWVSGGSGAFRKSIWNKLGGMSEIYNPFYWEDIDLSYRAMKAGYKIVFAAQSIVHHYHSEGKIKTSFSESTVRTISFRNQFLFIWSNVSDRSILLTHFFWMLIRCVQSIFSGDKALLEGVFAALKKFPDMIKKRKSRLPDYYSDYDVLIPFSDE